MSEQDNKKHRAFKFMLTLAAFVVVVAGIKTSASILVPLILAIFLAVICSGPFLWLRKKRVPSFLAILFVVLGIIVVFGLIGTLLGTSIGKFISNRAHYEAQLSGIMTEAIQWVDNHITDFDDQALNDLINPAAALKIITDLLRSVTNTFTRALIIVLIMIFILAEVSGFPMKVLAALGEKSPFLDRFELFTDNLMRYFTIKTLLSLATGAAVAVWLTVLGVDFAILWGFLAFILNFIPNVGSILAAIPAILLALLEFGSGLALVTGVGYVVINLSISLTEPRFMGRGLGLSPLVVFISLIFWGWVFGPMGMIISAPLTMILKIALETFTETRWLAILLGTESAAKEVIPGKKEASSKS